LTQFDEQLVSIKINCGQNCSSELEQFHHNINQRLQNFDYQINEFIEKERHIQKESSKLLSDLDSINPLLFKLTEEIETYEIIFNETESIENFVKLHHQIKQIRNELSLFNSTKLEQLNESIQQYTNNNIRHESTQLSTTLMHINNRYRVLTQDLNRFFERIDERIESETNNSIETYRKFTESLHVKLTRIRDDYRITIDVKQRLINVNLII
jgi:HPt (histidine-containing phosphotransfer) domain-containing protein